MEHKARSLGLTVIVLFVGLLIISGGLIFWRNFYTPAGSIKLTTPTTTLKVEVAKTNNERTIGLSNRGKLDAKSGMLFYFDESSKSNCFWMKETLIPLDMVFLDSYKKIVTVYSNVTPDTYPDSYCPSSDAKYGLEINSGLANEYGLIKGSEVHFD